MCKQKCEQCKCGDKQVNYDDYICTTSPHHIRNKQIDIESTTFTVEDENLYLINLGEI
ncbi:hypothetical protein [Vibrio phage vB_VibM_10AMN]|uniref:Uncharacterized protein n=1 Tax=Staphylococcus phage vB_VibM_10AMN12 TaxID=3076785 RepID=A0AA96KSJ1_9CAUD|nr:hypothetical protein [Vibrio phage vB_VibM_10AMN]WNO47434.1 hypothetical protein [Staphylococcus phage vB_VibM_10AMN12]